MKKYKEIKVDCRAINWAIGGKEDSLATLQKNLEIVLDEEFDQNTVEIDGRLIELQNELRKYTNIYGEHMLA